MYPQKTSLPSPQIPIGITLANKEALIVPAYCCFFQSYSFIEIIQTSIFKFPEEIVLQPSVL